MSRVLGQCCQSETTGGPDEERDLARSGGAEGSIGLLDELEAHHNGDVF